MENGNIYFLDVSFIEINMIEMDIKYLGFC